MDQREYKAVHTMPISPHIVRSRDILSQLYGPRSPETAIAWKAFDDYAADQLKHQRDALRENATDKLRAEQRQGDLLNLYLQWNEEADTITATYVFSNRNTALMFKLSL